MTTGQLTASRQRLGVSDRELVRVAVHPLSFGVISIGDECHHQKLDLPREGASAACMMNGDHGHNWDIAEAPTRVRRVAPHSRHHIMHLLGCQAVFPGFSGAAVREPDTESSGGAGAIPASASELDLGHTLSALVSIIRRCPPAEPSWIV